MKKTQSYSFKEFFNHEEESLKDKLLAHFKKHHIKYKIIGTTIIIFIAGGVDFATPALAATETVMTSGFDPILASSIDVAGKKIYYQLMDVGKWIIILKGATETIKSVTNGDFDGAKKHFFSYLIVYLILLGLPWSFDKIEELFEDLA